MKRKLVFLYQEKIHFNNCTNQLKKLVYLSFIWIFFYDNQLIIRIFPVWVLTVFHSWVLDFFNEILVFKICFLIIAGTWKHIQILIISLVKLINKKYVGWKNLYKKIHMICPKFLSNKFWYHPFIYSCFTMQPGSSTLC